MTQYGLTKELIESGDLRTMLAVEPDGSEHKKLFETVRRLDDLIVVKPGKRPVLSYNAEALTRYEALQQRLFTGLPFTRHGVAVSGPSGLYRRGTIVLAGTSGTLNIEFLKQSRDFGIPIMGMGNIFRVFNDVDFWIGYQDILGYLPRGVESQRITAFVRTPYIEDGLWEPMAKRQSAVTPADSVNTLAFCPSTTPIEKWLEVPVSLSDFGHASTFTVALSAAIVMGFQNILLTGVTFGGSLENYFCFEEVPYQDVLQRKGMTYQGLRTDFPEIRKACAMHAIRLYSVGPIPVPVTELPPAYMSRALNSVLALTRRVDPAKIKVTLPADRKRRYLALMNRHQARMVSPMLLLDKAQDFVARVPDRFANDTVKKAVADFQAAEQKGGCVGCRKNALAKPLYDIFEAGVKAKDPVLLQAWKALLPEHWIVKVGLMKGTVLSEMVFREDHARDREEWEDTKL